MLDDLIAAYLAAIERGESPDRDALLAAHPAVADGLRAFFADHDRMRNLLGDDAAFAGLTGPYAGGDRREDTDQAGTVIAGRYKLLQRIGEGGMGSVYMAEQTTPVKRLVAVKLIKAGMDSKQVLARFEAERQALALMDHPNIARVLDGGTTEAGRPYFAMELVRGVPVTRYCDERRLGIPARLELFRQVCAAVQHAHQKGVIHRDLKPSNVLVTEHDGKPVPKVIDFGLAKALHTPGLLTERTLYTAFGAAVGTPLYMAPEQVAVNALDVDTRTDIYALGVMLYELLTGTTPVARERVERAAWDEVQRVIREEEPPRPSARLSTAEALPAIAARRDTEPGRLGRLVRGDLDWVVMKALEKDRNRRYDTAAGFAEDVRRFLADEPVTAGPPTVGYRVRKFVRRNRGTVVAASVLATAVVLAVAGLAVGLVQTQWAMQRVAEEKGKTEEALVKEEDQRRKAEALAASIQVDLDVLEREPGMRMLKLVRTLPTIPPDARGLRDYVFWCILSLGQSVDPFARFSTTDGFPVLRVSVSPNGRQCLTESADGSRRIWDTLSLQLLFQLPFGDKFLEDVFAETGEWYSTRDGDSKVIRWNQRGNEQWSFTRFSGAVRNVVVDWNNRRMIIISDPIPDLLAPSLPEPEITLLNAETGQHIARLRGHEGVVHQVVFSSDGRWILTGGIDRSPRVWSAEDGRLLFVLPKHKTGNCSVAINTESTVACTFGGTLRWYCLPSWDPYEVDIASDIVGNSGPLAFLHPRIVRVGYTGLYKIGERIGYGNSKVTGICSDGRYVLDERGDVYDIDEQLQKLAIPARRRFHPRVMALNKGQRLLLLAGDNDGSFNLYDLDTQKVFDWDLGAKPIIYHDRGIMIVPHRMGSVVLLPQDQHSLPDSLLSKWAQVLLCGELDSHGGFVKWEEHHWEDQRQVLLKGALSNRSFPFPGSIRSDRLYWLKRQVSEAGLEDASIPLHNRLIAADSSWRHYSQRAQLYKSLEQHELAARDCIQAARLAGPRFWNCTEWHYDWGDPDLILKSEWRTAANSACRQEEYLAALEVAKQIPADRFDNQGQRAKDRLCATLLYRLGRFADVPAWRSRDQQAYVHGQIIAVLASPILAPVLQVPAVFPTDPAMYALLAMCEYRLGKTDAAKTGVRPAIAMAKSNQLDEHQQSLLREAEELILGKKP